MTEYVWVLPRVLRNPSRASNPPTFHPYRKSWRTTKRTDCGLAITAGGLRARMLVGDRRVIEQIAAPCARCYR